MKRIISLFLCVLLLCGGWTGCASSGEDAGGNLMKDMEPQVLSGQPMEISGKNAVVPMDFSVRLFQASCGGEENAMISPVSVLYALAMTANGARGGTLTQMEAAFGMTVSELNAYLKAYRCALPEDEKYKLSIANSIWITDDDHVSVEQAFLQTNADFYGADIYQVPFDDAARNNINSWVEDNTDGMIRNILDEIPQDAVMYLINAIAFDAQWQEIYESTQIREGVFTTEHGEEQKVEMMHSEELLYLDGGNAVGFIKPYADSKYAFAVLLPNEGVSVEEYISTLTGEKLAALLAAPQEITVFAAMPKLESEYSVEMSEILTTMGMRDAFDMYAADFSGLGSSTEGNIFISRVLHKTFISVSEQGTRAGAATVVEMTDESAAFIENFKEVVLDRPFVYMIIDCEANLPLFMGTMMDAA